MFDLNVLLTLATLLLVAVTWLTDYFQWRSIRNVDAFLHDARDVGEQFGDYLMEKNKLEDGREVTNLQIMAADVGQVIAHSFKMGVQGIASGESRRFRAIENGLTNVMESEMSVDQKAVISLAKRVGEAVGFDVSPSEVSLVAQKLGLSQIFRNNGSSGGGSSTW